MATIQSQNQAYLNSMQTEFKISIQQTLTGFIEEATSILSETVLKLQCDEVISQMRSDPSLYEFKMAHIQELIRQQVSFDTLLAEAFSEEVRNSKMKIASLSQLQRRRDQEYLDEIANIEDKCRMYMREKEGEIQELRNHEVGTTSRLETDSRRIHQQLQEANTRNRELEEAIEINSLASGKRQRLSDERFKLLQGRCEKEERSYEEIIANMKNDMHLIKSQWQKKCQDTATRESAKYQEQILLHQQKMEKQLLEYVESLKLGGNVIIREDDQISRSKFGMMKEHYELQMGRISRQGQTQLEEIELLTKKLQQQEGKIDRLGEHAKQVQIQAEENQCAYELQIQRVGSEFEKVSNRLSQNQSELKHSELEGDALQNQNLKLADQLKLYKRKIQTLEIDFQEASDELEKAKRNKQQINQQIRGMEESLEDANSLCKKRGKEIDELSRELESTFEMKQKFQRESQAEFASLQNRLAQEYSQNKLRKLNMRKEADQIDKTFLLIKKLQKELILAKEQIKYQFQISKTQLCSDIHHHVEAMLSKTREDAERKSKQKMAQLLNEVEENQQGNKQVVESLKHENANIRSQLKEYDQILERKDRDYELAKHQEVSDKIREVEKIMGEQLRKERRISDNLRYQMERSNTQYEKQTDELENSVHIAIRKFTEKWSSEIAKCEEEIKSKDRQIIGLTEQADKTLKLNKKIIKERELQEEEIENVKQRYQKFKHKSQQSVQDLLKRLDHESKHKLSLQQELREIRIKASKYDNPERSSKDKEGRARERNHAVYTTARQNQNQNRLNLDEYHSATSFKEKQFSELRQMIAKTYQAFGDKKSVPTIEPEKDHHFMKRL